MRVLSRLGYVDGFYFLDFIVYEHCLYCKQTQMPHKNGDKHKSKCLASVYIDVYEPLPYIYLKGASYFATLIDNYSRKVWVIT